MMSEIQWKIKQFDELTLIELYNLLELRCLVFVVEQNCVYQDIDGKDKKALHLIGELDSKIVAYCRLFKAGDYFENASIGRVVIHPEARHKKLGYLMMQEAINGIEHYFKTNSITISAQLYLQKFYESHGFLKTSAVYLEDDIEHIEMKKS